MVDLAKPGRSSAAPLQRGGQSKTARTERPRRLGGIWV